MKLRRAERGIYEECNLVWVVERSRVRKATLQEMFAGRARQAETRERLAQMELRHLTCNLPREYQLERAAREGCMQSGSSWLSAMEPVTA